MPERHACQAPAALVLLLFDKLQAVSMPFCLSNHKHHLLLSICDWNMVPYVAVFNYFLAPVAAARSSMLSAQK